MDAIIAIETGGNCAVRGGSLEIGCTQMQPATWQLYAQEVYGYVPPFTPVNEKYLATRKVEQWIRAGYTDYQIFLMWNAGRPVEIKGVNKYGVAYDSKAYAQRGIKALAVRH